MDRTRLLDPHKKIRWDNLYTIMTQMQEMFYPKSRQVKMFIEDVMDNYNRSQVAWDMPHEDVCYECLGTGLQQRTKADEQYLESLRNSQEVDNS